MLLSKIKSTCFHPFLKLSPCFIILRNIMNEWFYIWIEEYDICILKFIFNLASPTTTICVLDMAY